MTIHTVAGTISGVVLSSPATELNLGRARIYANPLWDQTYDRLSAILSHFDYTDPESGNEYRVAKFLVDTEFETDGGSIQGSYARQQLEEAVLPLRLGTMGRIQVSLIRLGGGARRDITSVEGVQWKAPHISGRNDVAVLSPESYDALNTFAGLLDRLNLENIQVPIEVFNSSFYRSQPIDHGIDLLVALEALFSESAESISLKVALRCSCILTTNVEERKRIFKLVRDAYKHRNTIVHGTRQRSTATQWFHQHFSDLETIVRRSLCCYIKLYEMGNEMIPSRIDDYLFSSRLLAAPSDSQIEYFIPIGNVAELHLG